MAITINHGNIASALGLAAYAGRAQRQRVVAQQDLQFLGQIETAQHQADQDYANQIQTALQAKQADREAGIQEKALERRAADDAQRQSNQDREFALQQQTLQQTAADRAASRDIQGQRVGLETQHQDTRQQGQDLRQTKYDDQSAAINSLPPEMQNAVRANGGRFPYIPSGIGQDQDGRFLESESRRLSALITAAEKEQKKAAYDPNDVLGSRGVQSKALPGAAAGMEPAYQLHAQAIADFQKQLAVVNAGLQKRQQSVLAPGTKVENPTAKAVLDYMRTIGGGGQAAQPTPGTGNGSGASPDNPVQVATVAEYTNLPSGTYYRDPQGNVRRKA